MGEGLFHFTISLGEVVQMTLLAGAIVAGYVRFVRKLDSLEDRTERTESTLDELRKGRGLILEHWPWRVRACFGFDRPNGGGINAK